MPEPPTSTMWSTPRLPVRAKYFGFPVGFGFVVDEVVGTECFPASKLLVGGAGEDDGSAMHFGDLESEERNATRAEDEDCLAGADAALFHEPVPGGESGAGERGRFFVRHIFRNADQTDFGEDALGGEDPVDGAAESGLTGVGLEGAVVPVLEERARLRGHQP